MSVKVNRGHGDLGTTLNFDTSREAHSGKNDTLTIAPAHIGEDRQRKELVNFL